MFVPLVSVFAYTGPQCFFGESAREGRTQIFLELLLLCVEQHNCYTPYLAHPSQGERERERESCISEPEMKTTAPLSPTHSQRPQASVVTATKSLRIALLFGIVVFKDGKEKVSNALPYNLRAHIPFSAILFYEH